MQKHTFNNYVYIKNIYIVFTHSSCSLVNRMSEHAADQEAEKQAGGSVGEDDNKSQTSLPKSRSGSRQASRQGSALSGRSLKSSSTKVC